MLLAAAGVEGPRDPRYLTEDGARSRGPVVLRPHPGAVVEYRNPKPTVDAVIDVGSGVVLIRRKNPPYGWALPGGFVDEGEPVEVAAVREAREETGLEVELLDLLYVYSDPARDARMHTISVVFTARASGHPVAADDAAAARVVAHGELAALLATDAPTLDGLPFAFDHADILRDYVAWRGGRRRKPVHGQAGVAVPLQP